jgi:hypothetical protein
VPADGPTNGGFAQSSPSVNGLWDVRPAWTLEN